MADCMNSISSTVVRDLKLKYTVAYYKAVGN